MAQLLLMLLLSTMIISEITSANFLNYIVAFGGMAGVSLLAVVCLLEIVFKEEKDEKKND